MATAIKKSHRVKCRWLHVKSSKLTKNDLIKFLRPISHYVLKQVYSQNTLKIKFKALKIKDLLFKLYGIIYEQKLLDLTLKIKHTY